MYVISVLVSYPNSERLGWTGDWSPGLALGLDGTGDRSPGPKARTGTGVRAVCQDWDGLGAGVPGQRPGLRLESSPVHRTPGPSLGLCVAWLTRRQIEFNLTLQHYRGRVEHLISEMVQSRRALNTRWHGSFSLLAAVMKITAHMVGLQVRLAMHTEISR